MIKPKLPDKSLHTLTSTSLEPAEILQLSCTFNSCEEGASRFVDANPINPESIEGLLAPILAGLFGLPYGSTSKSVPQPETTEAIIVDSAYRSRPSTKVYTFQDFLPKGLRRLDTSPEVL